MQDDFSTIQGLQVYSDRILDDYRPVAISFPPQTRSRGRILSCRVNAMSLFDLLASRRQSAHDAAPLPSLRGRVQAHGGRNAGHRREIDGLRAIAVLSVVFYHFRLPGFGGGFVGVDIFFVISGFLIGGILWRDVCVRRTISLKTFYVRRILRIAPAYVAMAAVSGLVGYMILLPFEFREFGKDLIASVAYLSNVQFFRDAGYFDAAAESKILLHTWSLSLEEQFYILLPVLMLLLRRRRRLLVAALGAVFAISLAMCVLVTPISNVATFYLLPFRIWELLAGVLLAIHMYGRGQHQAISPVLSWVGLAAICGAVVFVVPGSAFPGSQAVLPVAGTVLVIRGGRGDNAVNRLLSSPPAVFFGLISYSLYLWHWPALTLSEYYLDAAIAGPLHVTTLFAAVVGLSWLSWRFVERPFREMRFRKPAGIFAGAAASSAVLLALGGTAYVRDGMAERFATPVRMHIDASADFLQDWSRCSVPASGAFEGVEVCPIGPDKPPTFVVWGDSHVRAFKEGLARLADETGSAGLIIWRAGCPPLFDIRKEESAATRSQDADCMRANARIREAFAELPGIERVLLIGRWAYYAEGKGVGRDSANTIRLSPAEGTAGEDLPQPALFEKAVLATIGELSQRFEVLVLQQVPEVPFYDSREVARRLVHSGNAAQPETAARFAVSKPDLIRRTALSEKPFHELAAEHRIVWLSSWSGLCAVDTCSVLHSGRSYYFDNNHITNSAALDLRHLFDPVMDDARRMTTQARVQ